MATRKKFCLMVFVMVLLLIAGGTFVSLRLWDKDGILDGKKRPVSLPWTTIYWNGKNVTRRFDRTLDVQGNRVFDFRGSYLSTNNQEGFPPQDRFAVSVFSDRILGEEMPVTGNVGSQMGVLWLVDEDAYVFARNGKSVRSIFFEGLEDDELIGLGTEGLLLQFTTSGEQRILYCTIADSRGVKTEDTGIIFEIQD